MASDAGAIHLQIKEEQYATDVGGYFPVWNVYRDHRQVAMCFSPDDAREVYEGLLCWASAKYEASNEGSARRSARERSAGDGG